MKEGTLKSIQATGVLALLLLSFLVLSCESDSSNPPDDQGDLRQAIFHIQKLEDRMSQGLLLENSAERDFKNIDQLLYRLRVSLTMLNRNPRDVSAIRLLMADRQLLKDTSLNERDRLEFGELESLLDPIILRLSSDVDLRRTGDLFVEEFSTGLGQFQDVNLNGEATWYVPEGKDYAMISGWKKGANENWLVSPILDLKDVEDPVLTLRQTVGHFTSWDDMEVRYSLNYEGGDPREATWQTLDHDPKPPTNQNWQWKTTEPISLQEFRESPFTLAFVYKSTSSKSATWEIEFVKIFGTGLVNSTRAEIPEALLMDE